MIFFSAMFLLAYSLGYWVARRTHEHRDYHKTLQRNKNDLRKSITNWSKR